MTESNITCKALTGMRTCNAITHFQAQDAAVANPATEWGYQAHSTPHGKLVTSINSFAHSPS